MRFDPQTYFIAFVFPFSILLMTYVNAVAAQRMPITSALPDIVHEMFPYAEIIRNSPSFTVLQPSNIVCLVFAGFLIASGIALWNYANIRKWLFIYSVMCLIRALSFLVTSLPAPCSGFPNCPCSDPDVIKSLNDVNSAHIAFSWAIGLGMFSPYPQCGDLIISGHTMYLALAFDCLSELYDSAFPYSLTFLLKASLRLMYILSLGYIIVARNHYSIDVVLGLLLERSCWFIYTSLQKEVKTDGGNIFVRWLERRSVPLITHSF